MDNKQKQYKSFNLFNYRDIPQISHLTAEQKNAIEVVGRVLPFKTNNYVIEELIDWNNIPDDPIFTLTFPRKEMLSTNHFRQVEALLKDNTINSEIGKKKIHDIRLSLNPAPAGQLHNVPKLDDVKLSGIQHKYRETALFFPSQGQTCHAYCTFCFRWSQFAGMSEHKFSMKETDLLLKYLKKHTKITDLLITGGDPLTMSAELLKQYILPLLGDDFKHIRTIRIGTKSLAYWPYRFLTDSDSSDLLSLFELITKSGKNLSIQAHFNHPVELSTDAVKQAISKILGTGAQIRTQSPVLRKINDNADIWVEMWRKQVDLNCIPYYMFVARDTGSKTFFELPLEKCVQIFRDAYSRVSGICRTVRGPSMSADPGKIQVIGTTEIKGEKVFILQYLQAKDPRRVNIPFFAKYSKTATWIDQLEPAFDESAPFFQ